MGRACGYPHARMSTQKDARASLQHCVWDLGGYVTVRMGYVTATTKEVQNERTSTYERPHLRAVQPPAHEGRIGDRHAVDDEQVIPDTTNERSE